MVMRVLALTKKVEPSLPLSQRMRATSRQSPFPMFLFAGIQRNVKRPSARMWRWAIGAEFWALRMSVLLTVFGVALMVWTASAVAATASPVGT